jgi:hypothetical protein
MFAFAYPGVNIGIVAHDGETTIKLLNDLRYFLEQLKVYKRGKTDRAKVIELPNKSTFVALTAGSKTTGRSWSYSLLICSEAAWYKDSQEVMTALLGSCKGDAQVILESTASAGDTHFRRAFEGDRWTKFFSDFEKHHTYKKEADSISDEEWENLKKSYGFTVRESAAWWYDKWKEFGEDTSRMLKEYPLCPEHAFLSADGRFISVDPPVRDYHRHKEMQKLKIFTPPETNGRYVISVDTAGGEGGDDSVILVYNCTTNEIDALFTDNYTKTDELPILVKKINLLYKARYVIIETTGIGDPVYRQCVRDSSMRVLEYKPNNKTRMTNFLTARRMINDGLAADEVFRDNCQSCFVEYKGKEAFFSGRKDCIAALSFIAAYGETVKRIQEEPPERVVPAGSFDAKKHIQKVLQRQYNSRPNGTFRPL